MAFNLDTWTRQTAAFNSGLFILDAGSATNGPAYYTYSSETDSQAVIAAANYFAPVVVDLKVSDIIDVVGSDANARYVVVATDNNAQTISIEPFGTGDIPLPVELEMGGTGSSLSSLPNTIFAQDGTGTTILTTTLPDGMAASPPTADADVATKGYVDSAVSGLSPTPACYAASTANLTSWVYNNGTAGVGATLTAPSNGVFTVDGVNPPVASFFLYKNDTSGSGVQNGIYTVTSAGSVSSLAVLTRATTYDTPAEINASGIIPILNGTQNGDSSWLRTNAVVTIGTTPIVFVQFGQPHINLPLSMAQGGTNANLTPAPNSVMYTNGSAVTLLPPVASKVLSTDSSGNLFWGADGGGNINPGTTNQLPYYSENGDTLSPIPTVQSAMLITSASGAPQFTPQMTAGQIVIGSNAGKPVPGTITAGSNITVTNGNNTITISASGGGGGGGVNPGLAGQIGYYKSNGSTIYPGTLTAGQGISFDADTVNDVLTIATTISKTSFTPILKFGGNEPVDYFATGTQTSGLGICTFSIYIILTTKGGVTGDATISNIPQSRGTSPGTQNIVPFIADLGVGMPSFMFGINSSGTSSLQLYGQDATTVNTITDAELSDGCEIFMTGTFNA